MLKYPGVDEKLSSSDCDYTTVLGVHSIILSVHRGTLFKATMVSLPVAGAEMLWTSCGVAGTCLIL